MSAQIAGIVAKAIRKGFNAKSILEYISQKYPQYSNAISHAITAGYAADKVLKYLVNPRGQNPDNDEYLTDSEKTDKNDRNMKKKAAIGLGMAGLGILGSGTALALRGGSAAAQALNAAGNIATVIPEINESPLPELTREPSINSGPNVGQQIGQQASNPVSQAMQPANEGQIQQAAQAIPSPQPQEMVQNQPIFEQLLGGIDPATLDQPKQEQLKFLSMISDQLQSKGKTLADPEFKNLAKKIKGIVSGKPGMLIEESARFNQSQTQENPNVKRLDIEETQEPASIIEPVKIEKPQDIKKGDSVVTEDGNLAEIKGQSGSNFLIEENGKVRQVPMNSLRSQPEAIKNSKIVFDPSKVPESDRSAALAISLPMPDRSAIVNMFHDGSFYIYKRKDGQPIDESVVKRIIEGQDIPISTGETFMGAWNQENGDSRGSASFKELTAMAQNADEEDDPSKPLIFEKITNSFTHGYLKEFQRLLKESTRMFSAKPKKTKK